MLPDLESIQCFEAAASRLNFRQAAAAVALSPAAFGDRIRRLEEQVGASLFMRTTRRVVLTPEGATMLPRARALLADARACLRLDDARRAPFTLSLGTRFELGLSWLTPALKRLKAERPERAIHLVFNDSAELINSIVRGMLDAAVTSVRLTSGGLTYEVLHEEQYAFVGQPAVLRRNRLRCAEDAMRHTLIDTLPELPLFRYFADPRPAEERWDFENLELLGAIGAVRLRVLDGAGVAVLPRYFIRRDVERGDLKEILPGHRLQSDFFRLVWRSGHPMQAELRALAMSLRALPLR